MSYSAIVTGASGFLGSSMTSHLLANGYQVVTIDRSSSPSITGIHSVVGNLATLNLATCIPIHNYVACFHFAGASSVLSSFDDPSRDFMSSVPGILNLIYFLSKYYPNCRLLVASSAAVYGNPPTLPVKESCPLIPISPYGIHKVVIEKLCEHYSRLLNFPISILRIFSAYGAGQQKQLLWDTSKKLYKASCLGLDFIKMWGTGNETRDFIHATDVARAALSIAQYNSNIPFDTLNVAAGKQTQISDIVKLLCNAWGNNLHPVFGGDIRIGDPQQWCADVSYLNQHGYMSSILLEDGICDYVLWVKRYFATQ